MFAAEFLALRDSILGGRERAFESALGANSRSTWAILGLPRSPAAFEDHARQYANRGRARLYACRLLALEGAPTTARSEEVHCEPDALDLAPPSAEVHRLRIRFLTPTELKDCRHFAERPEFEVLIARIRDRLSTRTGQSHPLGGFTGEAVYEGPLTPFLPYLEAARFTGVGRQTVWGKGEIALTVLNPA